MDEVEKVKKALKKKKDKPVIKLTDLLSSGSTLINKACSGRFQGAFAKGYYYIYIGDSSSGKTWYCLSALAEATINENFDDYDLVYNNVEHGVLMDVARFFGKRLKKRMEMISTPTIEEMYDDLHSRLLEGPIIYILDSTDGLESEADNAKFEENKKKRKKGLETKGSMGDGKAKYHSQNLRRCISLAEKNGSILIFVSQTRDNIDAFGYGDKKTRAGGKALKFYAGLEIWTSSKGNITTKYNNKDRQQGIKSIVKIKKNRIAGRDRSVLVPIYHSHGIDDLGGCVDYLIDEGHWRVSNGVINAKEFDVQLKREKLIAHIELEEEERALRKIVSDVWDTIESAVSIKRKNRYDPE